jgi:general secretion pathway protein K
MTMASLRQDRDDNREHGFILVAVLWILGALATLAVVYSFYQREAALDVVNHDQQIQARALAVSAVELAAYQLTSHPDAQPLTGRFTFQQGSATITAEYRSEDSRIDLNFAPVQVLAGLFTGLGVDADSALTYAGHVAAWRTPLPNGADDSEAAFYQAAGKNYGPRHGPFQDVNELGMVAEVPPLLVDRVLPYLTVYSGRPEVNVLGAAPQVLAALPGLTPERLQLLLSLRTGSPQDVMRAQFGSATSYVTLEPSPANRVTVSVRFSTGDEIRSEAVILLLDSDRQPYSVLWWHDGESSNGARGSAGTP